ncbi:hypothetical protein FOA52_007607 [Chlamydomonas sp. UWO 241]|nr:hypothetical protein FOA52_007607 [Chlamydomonas sp. UWO 241]
MADQPTVYQWAVGLSARGAIATLLDILALRKTIGSLSGQLTLNGQPYTASKSRHLIAYVPQEEVMPPSLTAGEMCAFWAALTLPRGTSKALKRDRCAEVLSAVGLAAHAGTLVGGPLPGGLVLRGLSGGERKRLSVASALMERPPVLFLDEPTTGLDGSSALSVCSCLRDAAAAGHTIVASIHQPRTAVWGLFTQVVVLSRGRMIYSGSRAGLVPWLTTSLGYGPYDPQRHGAASDWVMDLVNTGFRKPEKYFGRTMLSAGDLAVAADAFLARYTTQQQQQQQAWEQGGQQQQVLEQEQQQQQQQEVQEQQQEQQQETQKWQQQQQQETQQQPLAQSQSQRHGLATLSCCGAPHPEDQPPTWLQQFRTLAWRELLLSTRNPADVAGRTIIFTWVGIVIGLVFWSDGGSEVQAIRTNTYALFAEVTAFVLLPFVYIGMYTSDKKYFVADSAAGLYHASAYYAAKVVVALPFAAFNVVTLSLVVYGMTGLSQASPGVVANWGHPVGEHIVLAILGYLVASQVIQFASLITTTQDGAFMVAIAWTAINILLSNTLLRVSDMTMSFLWHLRYLSVIWYCVAGMLRAQFAGGVDYSCADGLASQQVVSVDIPMLLPNNQILRSPAVQRLITEPGPECAISGSSILEYFDATQPSWLLFTCLAAYLLIMHALSFVALLASRRHHKT